MGVSADRDGWLERMGTPFGESLAGGRPDLHYQAADRGRMARSSHCTVINGPVIAPGAAKDCQRPSM